MDSATMQKQQQQRCHHHATLTLELSSVIELPSAQQRMYALVVSRIHIRHECDYDCGDCGGGDSSNVHGGQRNNNCHKQPNEQQSDRRWTLSFPISLFSVSDIPCCKNDNGATQHCKNASDSQPDMQHNQTQAHPSSFPKPLFPAPPMLMRMIASLRRSKNRIVVREWRQGASWWNLNTNHDNEYLECDNRIDCTGGENSDTKINAAPHPLRGSALQSMQLQQQTIKALGETTVSMAHAEVAGYRLARMAMMEYYCANNQLDTIKTADLTPGVASSFSNNSNGSDSFINSSDNNNQIAWDRSASFFDNHAGASYGTKAKPRVVMPEVLYFSHDENDYFPPPLLNIAMHTTNDYGGSNNDSGECTKSSDRGPWALLSYFGNEIRDNDNGGKHNLDLEIYCNMNIDFGLDFEEVPPTSTNMNGTINGDANIGENDQLANIVIGNAACRDLRKEGALMHRICTPLLSKTCANSNTIPCHHYSTTMTKIRHEFGFDEPHPRHGRVSTDECLEYAMMVLRDVILPIQSSFYKWSSSFISNGQASLEGRNANLDNVVHQLKWQKKIDQHLPSLGWWDKHDSETKAFQYGDMVALYHRAFHRISIGHNRTKELQDNHHIENKSNDRKKIIDVVRMEHMLQMLNKCVAALDNEWGGYGGHPPHLPPVVCHMDLQPQNLAFWHETQQHCDSNGSTCSGIDISECSHIAQQCCVASVMDWEEACFADPRFELLLVCRKVVANRDQADAIWSIYSQHVQRWEHSRYANASWEVGPIEPWLKLETVHSIFTLLLQAMDLLGGGRSPWETKPDLWGKIGRERLRLVNLGWSFCSFEDDDFLI